MNLCERLKLERRLIRRRSIYYARLQICRCGEILAENRFYAFKPKVCAERVLCGSLLCKRDLVCAPRRTCGDYERGRGLIMVEARGLTFQRDRWHTRLAHLRDFELWPEAAVAAGRRRR